jgi:acyl-CoA synthetase (AMP-forming)/AMP-acid ligase II
MGGVNRDSYEPALKGDHATIVGAMAAAAEQFGEREAYVDGARRLSYAGWISSAEGVAVLLAEAGTRPGDVVAMFVKSGIDYAICCAAIFRLGAIATGLNTRLGPREIDGILRQCSPAVLIADDDATLSPIGSRVIRTSEVIAASRSGATAPMPNVREHNAATIIWTSGTTGLPKGAWFDHARLRAAVKMAGPMSAPFDRRFTGTPFPHAGYMAKIWDQVAFGSTNVVGPPVWSAAEMLKLLVSERITVAGGVPTQWAKLIELPELPAADLSALRLCVTATAPAPPELVEAVVGKMRCPIIARYAMTESPSIAGTRPGDPPDVLFRTVGRAQEGVELEIVDDDGKRVGKGEVGRLRVRSDVIMRGYWGQEEQTAKVLSPDGWLITGDLGRFDGESNVILAGRVSDMYIRGGYNIYPLEVENVLHEHPAVAQAAVVGLATPVIGEIGVAFVVPVNAQAPPTASELRDWCKRHLADYKAPDRVEIVHQLPLTPIMKIDKAALRAQLAGEQNAVAKAV